MNNNEAIEDYNYILNNQVIPLKAKQTVSLNENLLLNTLFLTISSLSQKKYSSFSLLNSNILFSQSLELEKNRVSNNRFSGRDIA